jgi:hypothetical protein
MGDVWPGVRAWTMESSSLCPGSARNSLPQELGVEYICWSTSRGLQTVGRRWMKRAGMDVDHLGETVLMWNHGHTGEAEVAGVAVSQ